MSWVGFQNNCKAKKSDTPIFVLVMAAYRNRGIAPLILNLNASWRWVVNITSRPFYPLERSTVPINQETGWAPEGVWTFSENRKYFFPAGIRYRDHPATGLVTTLTELFLLQFILILCTPWGWGETNCYGAWPSGCISFWDIELFTFWSNSFCVRISNTVYLLGFKVDCTIADFKYGTTRLHQGAGIA
jgi:hypothetical protein